MGECIINNTSSGTAIGVTMSGTALMQFGVCSFNIPIGQDNFAIKGTSDNDVLYSGAIFQNGSTTKISLDINEVLLATAFTT
jgi:hypothetical protein